MWIYKSIWRFLCISWIIVGLLGELGDTVFWGDCQSEGLFKGVLENSRLHNYVISSRDVLSLQDCVVACINNEHCSSYNFQVSGSPLHKCELNSKSRSTARTGSLVRERDFQYYEAIDLHKTQDLCETMNCLNGGTCKENCEALSYPRTACECPALFTGTYCELPTTGNFLLNYNATTINDHISVSVTGEDFNDLSLCVWVKPSTKDGVVFSYATQTNRREIALLFNESSVSLHLGGQIIVFDIILPTDEWSHLCFALSGKTQLKFFYNVLEIEESVKLSNGVTIKGIGELVPAFEQISPGSVELKSASNLTVTRLYVTDTSLEIFEMLRLLNEPKFSMLSSEQPFRVDWRAFHHTNFKSDSSALIAQSDEPDIGNYDLKFSNSNTVVINVEYVPPLGSFVLAMWLRVHSHTKDATIFTLSDDSKDVITLIQSSSNNGYKFRIATDSTRTFGKVITDTRWFHVLWHWKGLDGKLALYKNGNKLQTITGVLKNTNLPNLINGDVRIGFHNFNGDITGLNLWSIDIYLNLAVILALNPGNAGGDIFSWKSVKEDGHAVSSPSKCHNRPGQFDLIFPQPDPDAINSISMTTSYTSTLKTMTAAFWIKVAPSVDAFTLISYAVPSEVNEFSVHFASTGIWVYIHANLRIVPFMLSSIAGGWHHFVITYTSSLSQLDVSHNGKLILETSAPSTPIISQDAYLVVGAQQSDYTLVNQTGFQFIGELSQLQIYRRLFTPTMITTLATRCWSIPGNQFEWVEMRQNTQGNIRTRNPSECIQVKNGVTY